MLCYTPNKANLELLRTKLHYIILYYGLSLGLTLRAKLVAFINHKQAQREVVCPSGKKELKQMHEVESKTRDKKSRMTSGYQEFVHCLWQQYIHFPCYPKLPQ